MTGAMVHFRHRRVYKSAEITSLSDDELLWLRSDADVERLADLCIILAAWIRDHVHPVPIGLREEPYR